MELPGGEGGSAEVVATTWSSTCLRFDHGSGPWHRSLKRKMNESNGEASRRLSFADSQGNEDIARVDIEIEAAALREVLGSHKQTVYRLLAELEKERNAAGSAATEAMSMILRIQHEKAEAQMEFRQFKRLAEQQMAHDQQQIAALEDLLFKRDQTVQALTCEIQAYRYRLLSYGIGTNADGNAPPSEPQSPSQFDTASPTCSVSQSDSSHCDYPSLRCAGDATADLNRCSSAKTPREHSNTFHQRVFHLERMRSSSRFMDKGVVGGKSLRRRSRRRRTFSSSSFASGIEFPAADCDGREDMSDRVCTVDAVHGASEDCVSTPRELQGPTAVVDGTQKSEIRKLYTRLQALEADGESMRQTLISMATDKAQMALLKEIAQQMRNEVATERKVIKKLPSSKKVPVTSMVKSVVQFALWRRRSRVKFRFGSSSGNAGLLLLLDKSPRMRHGRFLNKTQG